MREDALGRNPLEKMGSPKLDQELLDPIPTEDIQALLATCEKDERGLRDKAILKKGTEPPFPGPFGQPALVS